MSLISDLIQAAYLLLERISIGSLRVSCVKQVAYSVLQADSIHVRNMLFW
jgi:hypothetical protein